VRGDVRGVFLLKFAGPPALMSDASKNRSTVGNAVGAERLEAAINCISETFYALDADWRYVAFNAAAEEYFRVPAKAVLGKLIWDVFPQGRGTQFEAALNRARETGERVQLNLDSALRPGRRVELRAAPFEDGVCVAIADITARDQAERQLLDSEERLRLATEGAGIGVYEIDLSSGQGVWSASAFGLLGVEPAKGLRGSYETWRSAIHPADRQKVEAAHRAAEQRGAAWTCEYRIVRKGDGQTRWVQTHGQFTPLLSGAVRSIGVALDITERKLAEERLKQSERRLRFLDQLFAATKELDAADAVMRATTRLLGEHLDVDVCAYADVDEDQDAFTIRGDWTRAGTPSIVGAYSLAEFGGRAVAELHAGRPLVSHDNTKEGPRFLEIGLCATICMPLIKDGKLKALMAIHRARAQEWCEDELALLTEVTERSWAHIERVRAEAELRQSEERFRSLYDSIEAGFYIAELGSREGRVDYRYLEVNPAMRKLPGLSNAAGKWRRDIDAAPEEYWFELFSEVVRTQRPARVEHAHQGLQRWFEVYAYPIGVPADRRFAVLFSDITHRKQAEQQREQHEAAFRAALEEAVAARTSELQGAEARLRAISETSHMYQGLLGPDGVVLFVNATALQGIGAKADDVLGKYLWDTPWFAATPEAGDKLREVIARVAAGETIASTMPLELPQGLRHFDFAIRPIRNEAGEIVHILPEAIDVTARVEAEKALRQSQKLEAMGQLTGGVAHDFNNLLMIISGGLNMLERKDDPARREMLIGRMREAVERGAKLTQQLLAFSRKHDLAPAIIDFKAHVEAMRELLDRSLGGHVRVAVDIAPNLAPIYVDPTGLEQALLNLAVNARDAMPEGGIITIGAINGTPDDPQALCVSISVIDTGVGMSGEVIARVFEPFFTTKEIGKGSGLGLAQVHGFAQQSGGRVEIQSSPGKGAVVTLVLPKSDRHAVSAPRRATEQPPRPPDQEAGRVLLVEDDADVAAFTLQMLEELGWDVIHAESGERALRLLALHADIDFVFSDVMMPGGMNGLELARRIRSERAALPVLLTSGYAAPIAKDAAAAGVPLLAKPFSLEALEAAIAQAASRAPISG
jgi:PAS domain S-box-containing protein